MTAKFSVVVPIKDETEILRLSLPSIYALEPHEVVIPIEPNTKSIEIVRKIARKNNFQERTKIIVLHEKTPDWSFRQAYARRRGFREASNDLILTTDADIIVDPQIKNHFNLLGKGNIKLVSFSKLTYPVSLRVIMTRLVTKLFSHRPGFTGLYAFSKSAWQETENEESLKRILRGEDSHLHEALTKKYNVSFVPSVKNIKLRPTESRRYQYLVGWYKWKTRRKPLWRVLMHTFVYYRPWVLVGYLKARLGQGRGS